MTPQLLDRAPAQMRHAKRNAADTALATAARLWFLVAVIGQSLLAIYVISFYGRAVLHHDLARWNKVLAGGYVPGNQLGNFVLGLHLLLAVIITIGGPLQLIPQLRARLPALHRWNGRIYFVTAFLTSLAGLYLVWIKGGTVGGLVQHIGVSINAILIMFCAAMALRYALARQLAIHRRWALRLYLVVSGVWFFRVGLLFWIIVNHGPVGFNPQTFEGPFLDFLTFAQYLLPLAVLELYLRTQDHAAAPGKYAMGIGIFGATMGMWLPRIY